MSSKPQRSLRLEKRSARSLAVLSGAPGEIFFDNDNGTLRVYTDTAGSSIILANRQWVLENSFSGDFNDLTNVPVIPTDNSQLANGAGYATTAEVDAALANIDSGQIDLTGYATETYVDDAIDDAISNLDIGSIVAPATLDLIGDVIYSGTPQTNEVLTWNGTHWVNSIAQTDLSSYYTGSETDTAISTAISNFQTTIVDAAPAALDTLNELAAALNDDADFATTINNSIAAKQETLVSGTNIKTINSTSLLGSGDITVQPTLVSGTNIRTINNNSILGNGNLSVQPTLVSGTNIKTINGTTILGSGDLVIATGNPFDQDLNTTDDVEFNSVTSGTFTSTGTGAPVITSASTITLSAQDGVTVNGDLTVSGLTTLQETTEVLNTKTGASGIVVHDFSTGAVFYHTGIAADFTANFTNVPTTDDRTTSVALVLVQGATAYLPISVYIDGSPRSILWQGGSQPSGTTNGTDIVSFTFIRVSGTWRVIGSLTSYS